MSKLESHKSKEELEKEILKLRKEIGELKEKSSESFTNLDSYANQNSLFHSIFKEAGIGIAIIDKNWNIVNFNNSFLNLFGYLPDELKTMTYLDVIPEEKREKAKEFISAMFSSKLVKYQAEQMYIRKDKSLFWLKLTASVINDENGNPEYILGMGEDITEFKRQEKIRDVVYNISNAVNYTENLYQLIQTIKENLKSMIDAKHFYIALYDETSDKFSIPYLIDHVETFKTFPANGNLVGYVQKNKKSVLLDYKEILELQNTGKIDIEGKLSKQWLGVPLVNNEKFIGVLGVQSFDNEKAFNHNDLTILEILSNQITASIQKMRSEYALQIEKAYFKELFENSPEAIAIIDNSSNIININREFTALFGYTKQEALHKNIEDLISTLAFKSEGQCLTTEISKGKVIKTDTKRKKKNGEIVDVSLWGTPIIIDEGQVAIYAIFRDISERVESEQKLEEAKEKAEESDRLKTSFLTNMSHEIRTPMNAIIGFSELIAEPNVDQDSRKEFAEQIYASSVMLLKLIDDIIDISQLDSGNIKLTNKRFCISKALNDIYLKFEKEKLKENKPEIELLLHNPFGDLMVFIESDEIRFNQIFTHLLNNALKYTNKGFIEFGFDTNQNDEPIFYVRDTGIGIPEEKTNTIFNHFTKIEDRTKLYRGTGIGLTITKKLVNLLGGDIWVESNLGIGSIFYFTLKEKVSLVELNTKNSINTKIYNWAGKKILIAEDEDTNFVVIKASLARTHANLIRVKDGKEAVDKCLNEEFDLVLMDIQMPVLDGIEATKQIKAQKSHLPIIAQTAYVHKNERDLCLKAGCNEYIPKPIKSYFLLETIDKLILNGK
ncbi:MAG TPA: hypothetical protein DCG75_18000 [Bacteroidales bacterium]|nr:hypothetical protein [Bacteroidales bacterium]